MARPTSIRDFQAAQRGETDDRATMFQVAPSEGINAAELPIGTPGRAMQATHELIAQAEQLGANVHGIGPDTDGGPNPDYDPATDPQATAADHLLGLNVGAQCTAEMSLHMITERVREAALSLPAHYAPAESDVVAEAERIWSAFDANRKGPAPRRDWRRPDPGIGADMVATAGSDGVVADVWPAEMTPDRGPGVGTTVHYVSDDGPRFSGGGIPDATMELPGMPERESDDDESGSQARAEHLDPDAWGKVVDPERKAQILWPIKANGAFAEQMLVLATDLDDMVDYLTRTVPALQPLAMVSIRWYWRRKGTRANGQPVLIQVKKADETLAHERDCDIVVKLAADHLRKLRASALFVEYLVCSVLARIDPDGPRISPSDVWAWLPVWWRYGLLGPEHRLFGAKFAIVEVDDIDDLTGSPEPGPIWDDEDGERSSGGPMHPPMRDGAGTLIHADGTPLTEDEIAEMEARDLEDADDEDLNDGEDEADADLEDRAEAALEDVPESV